MDEGVEDVYAMKAARAANQQSMLLRVIQGVDVRMSLPCVPRALASAAWAGKAGQRGIRAHERSGGHGRRLPPWPRLAREAWAT